MIIAEINFRKKLPGFLLLSVIAAFIGLLIFTLQVPEGRGAEGSGYQGSEDVLNIIGTKAVPQPGATSTLGQLKPPFQTTTSTEIIRLQNADTIDFLIQWNATTSSSTLAWIWEVSNAADCEVDGPWFVQATTSEILVSVPQVTATPTRSYYTDVRTVGDALADEQGLHFISQKITGLNASCLKFTINRASSTDVSSLWVSAILK